MLTSETKSKLSDLLLAIGDGERQVEVIRQVLNEQQDFETYAAFQRIDRNKRRKITSYDISKFLSDNNIQHTEEACNAYIKRYDVDQDGSLNYTEFVNSVLVLTNKDLRKAVTSRQNYFVGPKEFLKPEVEYSLAKLLDKEISFYLGLDYLKIILHNRYDYGSMEAFAVIDRSSTGHIDFNSLQNFFSGQLLNPKDEEIFAILRRIEKKNNGRISFDEFSEVLELVSKNSASKVQKPTQAEQSLARSTDFSKSYEIKKELNFNDSNINRTSIEKFSYPEKERVVTFEAETTARSEKYAPYKNVSPAPTHSAYSPDKSNLRTSSLIRLTPVEGSEIKVGSGTPGAKKSVRNYLTSSTSFTEKKSLTGNDYKSPERVLGASIKSSGEELRGYDSRLSTKDLSISPKKKVTFSADKELLASREFEFRKRIEKDQQARDVQNMVREKSGSPKRETVTVAAPKRDLSTLNSSEKKAAFIAAELERLKQENERALELRLGPRFKSPRRKTSPRKNFSPVRAVTLGDERESIAKLDVEIRKRIEHQHQSNVLRSSLKEKSMSPVRTSTLGKVDPVEKIELEIKKRLEKETQALQVKSILKESAIREKTASPKRVAPLLSAQKVTPFSDGKNVKTQSEPRKSMVIEESNDNESLIFTLKQFVNIDKGLEVVKQDLALRPDFNILDFFRVFDTENKGAIMFDEFDEGLKQFGIYANREELHLLVRKFDKDKDGRLRFSDFAELVTPKQSDYSNLLHNRTPFKAEIINSVHEVFSNETIKCISKVLKTHLDNEGSSESLRQRLNKKQGFNTHNAFSYLDIDQDGSVDGDEIREILEKHDTYVTDRELKLLVERFDTNKDGKILYSEFVQEITAKSDKPF